jgi:hypothetical protein
MNGFIVGQWVQYPYDNNKIKGFILGYRTVNNKIQFCINKTLINNKFKLDYGWDFINTDSSILMNDDYIGIHPNDIGTMIDLALQTRDKEWFDQLIKEYKSWYPATKIKTLI